MIQGIEGACDWVVVESREEGKACELEVSARDIADVRNSVKGFVGVGRGSEGEGKRLDNFKIGAVFGVEAVIKLKSGRLSCIGSLSHSLRWSKLVWK